MQDAGVPRTAVSPAWAACTGVHCGHKANAVRAPVIGWIEAVRVSNTLLSGGCLPKLVQDRCNGTAADASLDLGEQACHCCSLSASEVCS